MHLRKLLQHKQGKVRKTIKMQDQQKEIKMQIGNKCNNMRTQTKFDMKLFLLNAYCTFQYYYMVSENPGVYFLNWNQLLKETDAINAITQLCFSSAYFLMSYRRFLGYQYT